jgi:hypothetical protein
MLHDIHVGHPQHFSSLNVCMLNLCGEDRREKYFILVHQANQHRNPKFNRIKIFHFSRSHSWQTQAATNMMLCV